MSVISRFEGNVSRGEILDRVESTCRELGIYEDCCVDCNNTGEVPVSEFDADSGRMMQGVGVQKCHCQHD